nr:hypothetical protein [Tanacetum cinerariifolium]
GNTLHWQWELTLPVETLSRQWKCLVHFIPNKELTSPDQTVSAKQITADAIAELNSFHEGDAEEQSNANNAAKEPVTAVDDVADQSVPSHTPLTPPPQQLQDIPSTSQVQSPPPQQQSPPPAQPQGANFPMSMLQEALDAYRANKVKTVKLRRLRKVRTSQRIESLDDTLMEDVSNQVRVIDELDKDEGDKLMNEKRKRKQKSDVPAALVNAAAVVTTTAPVKVVVPFTRRRKGVIIRDPKEESSLKTLTKTKSKDKGKNIDWEVTMEHVKQKAKENPYVQRYQIMKKKPQTEAQAQRNMMVYLKNTTGFTLDYFKGMSYDDIRPIFEAKFNSNMEFFLKSKEQMEEEESRAIALINETPAQKAAKRRRLNKIGEDVEELKLFGVDAAMKIKEKHQVFTTASEDISAVRQKLMLLVTGVK